MNNSTNSEINFRNATEIIVTQQNQETTFQKGDQKFEDILQVFLENIKDSHDMPAFGVSLDEETRKAKTSGIWLEFVFDSTKMHNDMPYDSLLIEVHAEDTGFNLIRKHNGKYDGRCFYFNLSNNMQALYNTLQKISKNKKNHRYGGFYFG